MPILVYNSGMNNNTGNESAPGNEMSVDLDKTLSDKPTDFSNAGMIGKAHREQINHPETDILMDMIMADACGGDQCSKSFKILGKDQKVYGVKYLADNLPAVQFVSQFYLELIAHGGLLAKDASNQKKLDNWLAEKNYTGQTNGNVIREALHHSIIYGYAGLRKIGSTISFVPADHFKIWKMPALMKDKYGNSRPIPGIKAAVVYEVRLKGEGDVIEDKERDGAHEWIHDKNKNTLKNLIKDQEWTEGVDGSFFHDDDYDGAMTDDVFIPKENFCHLRHSDEGEYGRSPLTKDRLRTTLIVDYIRNVIDEVGNDGTDYMMYLKQRGVAGASLTSMLSTSTADTSIKASVDGKQVKTATEKQMEVARTLARKLKRTAKTRFAIISQDWVERIEKLEGTVHLNEYLSILTNAKATIADIYGIPAMLAGTDGGGWSTGMSALIPFTLERTIKPFQHRYADQLSDIINACAGIKGGVKFKELDWSDERERAEIDKIKAETEKALAEANSKKVTDAKTMKETKLLTKEGVNGSNQNQMPQAKTATKTAAKKPAAKKTV